MIEQSPLGIQLFDLEGYCVQANRAWEELWGASRSDLIGYNIRQDPQLRTKGMAEFVERAYQGEAVVMPPMLYDPEANGNVGRVRWVRVFLYPVTNEEQGIQEVAVILEDITERRHAEEELRAAKDLAESNEKKLVAANEAKDRFLAILSHELRTPLTPVMATVQALQQEDLNEDIRPWLEIIHRNVELEARLIDDLLDLTRITKGKLQLNVSTCDVHVLLANVIEIYRSDVNAKGIRLSMELAAVHAQVQADPARLQQVFWNLVKNAVKFTPEGGDLIIHTVNASDGTAEVIRIEFTDTGIGIEPALLPKIFDAFEQGERTITRNFGGLGLGLAISKTLVDMHGGTLLAMSPGKNLGASFIVELDTSQAQALPPKEAGGARNAASSRKPRILLIDDHIDTSTAVRMLLERQGYEIRVANSAAEAIATAQTYEFDLIVSDIGLPDESGLTLLGKLQTIRSAPAIALSGFGTEEDVARSHEAGFQEHLTKPFNLQKLRETINQLLAK
jgi:PAS domain S-box-containing protein